jgi:hypothetical protein
MKLPPRLALLALALAGTLSAADPWKQMHVGMSAAETVALLGHPLAHRQGHGFSTWTYDDGAEVLLQSTGSVMGWTAPGSTQPAVRSRDVWRNRPAGVRHATMHAALPRPTKSRRPAPPPDVIRQGRITSYEEMFRR